MLKDYQIHKELSDRKRKLRLDKSTNKFVLYNHMVYDKGRFRPVGLSSQILNNSMTRSDNSLSSNISKRSKPLSVKPFNRKPSVQSSRSSVKSKGKRFSSFRNDYESSFAGLQSKGVTNFKIGVFAKKSPAKDSSHSRGKFPIFLPGSNMNRVILRSQNDSVHDTASQLENSGMKRKTSYNKLKDKISEAKHFFPEHKKPINARIFAKSQDSRNRLRR